MISKLFLSLLAASLTFPSLEALANPSVSFELVATFDYPGFAKTYAQKINDEGFIAGTVADEMGHNYGFTRSPEGKFSELISYPNAAGDFTQLYGINNLRQKCGLYNGGPRPGDGFLLSRHTFITADFPIAYYNDIFDINDAGNFCGDHSRGGEYSGFMNIDGSYHSFKLPGQLYTGAFGMNNLNQCVGYCYNDKGTEQHGFFCQADGTITFPYDAPGFRYTALYDINDKGQIVGVCGNYGGGASVLFLSPSEIALYRYPGATWTSFLGINNRGLISGTYLDAQNNAHGFIVRARLAAGK